jgi:uncharacterized membrane protein YfcA
MRLKLVLTVSLIAAFAGSGAAIAIVAGVFASLKPLAHPSLLVISTFVLPAATVAWASIFVYRHTARRRKLQAALTTILTLLLTLGAFVSAALLSARFSRVSPEPTLQPRNVG